MNKGVGFTLNAQNNGAAAMRGFQNGLAAIEKQTRAVNATNTSMMRGMSANRRAFQQIGFQVTDFSVQIAGGQSAMLAFIQQGGQVLQFFGMWGAVMAGFLSVFGTMAYIFIRTGNSINTLAPLLGSLPIEMEYIASAAAYMRDVLKDAVNVIANNLDYLVIAASVAALWFGSRWVMAMLASSTASLLASNTLRALIFSMYAVGPAATAAMVATSLLKFALTTLLPVALVMGVIYLIKRFLDMSKAVGGLGEMFTLLKEVASEVFTRIGQTIALWGLRATATGLGWLSSFMQLFTDALVSVSGFANSVIGAFAGAFSAVGAVWDSLPAVFSRIGGLAMNALIDAIQGGISGVTSAVNGLLEAVYLPTIATPDLSGWKSDVPAAVNVAGAAMSAFGDAYGKDYVGGIIEYSQAATNAVSSASVKMRASANAMSASLAKPMSAWERLKAAWNAPVDPTIDVFGMGGAGAAADATGGKGKGGGSRIPEIKAETNEIRKIYEDLSSSISSTMQQGFKSVLKGTMSVTDYLSDVLDKIADQIFDILMTPVFNKISGGIAGGIMRAIGMPSFAGGGGTGNGSRSGGLDGQGGFMALLHPQETVVDHAMGQSMRGGSGGTVEIIVRESPSFASSVETIARDSSIKITRAGIQEYDTKQLASSIMRVQNSPRMR